MFKLTLRNISKTTSTQAIQPKFYTSSTTSGISLSSKMDGDATAKTMDRGANSAMDNTEMGADAIHEKGHQAVCFAFSCFLTCHHIWISVAFNGRDPHTPTHLLN
jgi:hypothetical protein